MTGPASTDSHITANPTMELDAAARRHKATTIVVGGRTHGLIGGVVVGSVAQKLIRHSLVPVLVVRDGQAHRLVVASTERAG
jgi:nucleotide-binding universal stress UspA family protein